MNNTLANIAMVAGSSLSTQLTIIAIYGEMSQLTQVQTVALCVTGVLTFLSFGLACFFGDKP